MAMTGEVDQPVEAGRPLFGRVVDGQVRVFEARAAAMEQTPTSVRFATVAISDRRAAHRTADQSAGFVGYWHSHPGPSGDTPSEADIRVAADWLDRYRLDRCFCIITTPSAIDDTWGGSPISWARPRYHAWAVSRAGGEITCERANIQWLR